MADFENFSFSQIAADIHADTHLFVGEKEHPLCLTRAAKAIKKIKKSHLYIIPEAKHELHDTNYLALLKTVLR
ncbi:MAG: hypothetical protein H6765_07230 [Candidatus Peribacteria bacterium]|nr:MAG: hypothetical protein H6765_07230 [Candidatus Peribacteria bacterium]